MVYNPPIEKTADGSDPKPPPPAAVVPVNPMRRGAYVEQAMRATAWAGLYILGWLLMRLSCAIGMPKDCDPPDEALEVLTDILVLLVFSLGQAWFCEVLEERRFRELIRSPAFPIFLVGAALAISGLSREESLINDDEEDEEDLSDFQVTVFILLLIISAVFIAFHYVEAWRVLPGAHLISGIGVPRIQIQEDLLSIYVASRTLMLAYFIIYIAFSIERDDGWGYQHYLMAWVLSLFAQFKATPSVIWLGLTTGVFLQGIGAYRLKFLCDYRVHGT